jgi:spermidine synthase
MSARTVRAELLSASETHRTWQLAFYLIFFAAGMPALIYQVAWQRVLTLYFGVDIYSTSITVATFMLGLGLGSLLGGRLADRVKTPALCYAGIEAVMGGIGFASVTVFSKVGAWLAGGSLTTVILVDFALLLLPTTLMGMTLPLMCRIVIGSDHQIGRHLSWLYGVNTFGAALGALLSSYFLIGLLGLDGATHAAASLNLVLALVVYSLATSRHSVIGKAKTETEITQLTGLVDPLRDKRVLSYPWVLSFSLLSGFTALGYEIVWYRVLAVVLHGTVYVFGTILFFYLTGIALGSLLARSRIDEGRCIDRFAVCQLGIGAYSFVLFALIGYFSWLPPIRQLIGASFFTSFHPAPELIAGNLDLYSLYSLLDIGLWAVLIVGVPTVLMGYGFTNLMREGAPRVETVGHAVGGLYCANIVGSTLGSLTVGFALLQYFGTEHTLRLLIMAGCLVPVLVFAVTPRRTVPLLPGSKIAPGSAWLLASLAIAVCATFVFPGRMAIIRALHYADDEAVDFIGAEDRTGVSAVRLQHEVLAFDQEKGILGQQRVYIDGSHHGDASGTTAPDWGIDVALAAHAAPRRVLSIGLGDGQMAATAVSRREVQELVVIELNGTLQSVLGHTARGKTVLNSRKTRYVVDDGRRWLLANSGERFDVIMMFPLHAAHAFSGSLYSTEFLTILASHLGDGGILVVRTVDHQSTAKTVATVFPHVFRLDSSVYIASGERIRLDENRLPEPAEDVGGRITADRETILAHTQAARINTDLKPNSEFYITYPFVRSLQTRFRDPDVYRAKEDQHLWKRTLPMRGESSEVKEGDRQGTDEQDEILK